MKALFPKIILAIFVSLFFVIGFNLSIFSSVPDSRLKILAHRGVHQTFSSDGLTNDTCTAKQIHPPTHNFIENSIPSIRAAFDYGADMVEIDVQRTADGKFALFHDAKLECRTNGVGRVADHTMADLRALDIGYGYTADNGKTYPLRGSGAGMMTSLDDTLRAFPGRAFLINIKSNNPLDAEAFAAFLRDEQLLLNEMTALWAGPNFAVRWREISADPPVGTRPDAKSCAIDYLAWGWVGHVPASCKASGLVVPQNLSWLVWGWPRRTVARFDKAGVRVILTGPLGGENEGIETLEQVRTIPADFRGWIMTNHIEIVGPALKN